MREEDIIKAFRRKMSKPGEAARQRTQQLTMQEGLKRKQATQETQQAVESVSRAYDKTFAEMAAYTKALRDDRESQVVTEEPEIITGAKDNPWSDPQEVPDTAGPGARQTESTSFASYESGETQIVFELEGKKRPNPPKKSLLTTLDMAATKAFGPGAKVVVYSGMENEGHQHGSNRHRTGLAADIRVYRPDGSRVRLEDSDALDFAVAASQSGALAIGAGKEYMGDAFHIDMVPLESYSAGQGQIWGSWAKRNRDQLMSHLGG